MKIELNLRKRQSIVSVFLSFCADAFISFRVALEIENAMRGDCFNYQRKKRASQKRRHGEWRSKKEPLLRIRWVFVYQMKSSAKKYNSLRSLVCTIGKRKSENTKWFSLCYFFRRVCHGFFCTLLFMHRSHNILSTVIICRFKSFLYYCVVFRFVSFLL